MVFGALDGPFVAFRKPAEFIIMPLNDDGSENTVYGGAKILQYWPETLESGRSANWQTKTAPGLPTPLRQWTGGGDHTLNFVAAFSTDMDGKVDEDKHNVDVEAAIGWLESLCLPTYVSVGDSTVAHAPPVLWLYAPQNYLGSNWAASRQTGSTDSYLFGGGSGLYAVLNELSVTRANWFTSGKTRYATVALSFSETIQVAGQIFPYGAEDFSDLSAMYKRKPS